MTSEYAHIRIPGQDDDGIDLEGLRRQQLDDHAVGVTVDVAHTDHPNAFLARNHGLGPTRRHRVGSTQLGANEAPVYELTRVDLVTGIRINTGDEAALPTRVVSEEFHVSDLPQVTLAEALAAEDLAETAAGEAINQARKRKITTRFYPIR